MNELPTIDGEKAYPIYRVDAWWLQDIGTDEISDGKGCDATGYYEMYQEDPGLEGVQIDAIKWWEGYSALDKYRNCHLSTPILTVTFVRHEVWVLRWFSHWTFDIGQSDQEAIDSFERFVQRTKKFNKENGKWVKATTYDGSYWDEPYCLMGAEDRWRWHGRDEESPAPCRCDDCKKAGRIMICH